LDIVHKIAKVRENPRKKKKKVRRSIQEGRINKTNKQTNKQHKLRQPDAKNTHPQR
jgi:hypothetical protein